jgi:hypothetical protein
MRRILTLAFALLLLAAPAVAGRNTSVLIVDDVNVSTAGGALSVTVSNPSATTLWVIFQPSNEVGTASLVVTTYAVTALGDVLLTTNPSVGVGGVTRSALIGSLGTGSGPNVVSDFPATSVMKYVFTVTGAGASFDVSAYVYYVGNTAP